MADKIERPILFSAPMVRALIVGTKRQTRRAVKWKGVAAGLNLNFSGLSVQRFGSVNGPLWALMSRRGDGAWEERSMPMACPYGQPGDRLWVREAFYLIGESGEVFYRATGDSNKSPPLQWSGPWKPSIHMPRWASRIDLEIVSVHVERLQAISEADARAEGITDGGCLSCGNPEPCGCLAPAPDARDAYIRLWNTINGAGSWDVNPCVWVVDFRLVMP